jgi:hypothetical protein
LCYQSQISKFLRKNRRNPNLKQDSESSSKPWSANLHYQTRLCLRLWNYAYEPVTVSSHRWMKNCHLLARPSAKNRKVTKGKWAGIGRVGAYPASQIKYGLIRLTRIEAC